MKKGIKKKKGVIDKKVTILLRCLLLFLICWFIIYFAVDILDWQTLAKIENTKIDSIKKILRLTFVFVTICFSVWLINLKNKNSSENQRGTKNE